MYITCTSYVYRYTCLSIAYVHREHLDYTHATTLAGITYRTKQVPVSIAILLCIYISTYVYMYVYVSHVYRTYIDIRVSLLHMYTASTRTTPTRRRWRESRIELNRGLGLTLSPSFILFFTGRVRKPIPILGAAAHTQAAQNGLRACLKLLGHTISYFTISI